MNILFLTLININDIEESGIYQDLIRSFIKENNNVYVVSPTERRNKQATNLISYDTHKILRVKTLNIQKTGLIEKVLSTLTIQRKFTKAIKKHLKDVKFDLIVYATPPITFSKTVKYFKKRDGATTYLLLKDIFPQNAVDLGMMAKTGIKGLIYKFFRKKENNLYAVSDYIGCMSEKNVQYLLENNKEISQDRVEVCPNSLEYKGDKIFDKKSIREKYGIPLDKKILIYGGNLGKPQCVDFIIECIKECSSNESVCFLVVGSGTEYYKLKNFEEEKAPNLILKSHVSSEEFKELVSACDVGLIFLDKRFTIPNFPSRLLSYMTASLPVLASTDVNTDIKDVIIANNCGWWCESSDPKEFSKLVDEISGLDIKEIGENSLKCFLENYQAKDACKKILSKVL